MAIKLGIVGIGKIARAEHLPVLAQSSQFELVAAASRNASVDGLANFRTLADMLAAMPDIEAVSLCAPPTARSADARWAIEHGCHVMLEKPPGATLSEVHDLHARANARGRTLFATWHSRCAPGVAPAKAWLQSRKVRSVDVSWREDVRHWHPGQEWIFAAGGFGVFDPGINALSIVTEILPLPFALKAAQLSVPANRQAPIAAELQFSDASGADIRAAFDFLQTGPQTWDIRVITDDGEIELSQGGALARIDGEPIVAPAGAEILHVEYAGLYEQFAQLIAAGESDVDLSPLTHVADAFMLGERRPAPEFHY